MVGTFLLVGNGSRPRAALRRSRGTVVMARERSDWCDDRFYDDGRLLEWSSVTKTVTARLLVELERAAIVNSATVVSEILPFLDLGGATLRDLSFHRAGLPMMHPGAENGLFGDPCRGADDVSFLADRAGEVASSQSRLGEYRYSNLGYAILGAAVEAATGKQWFDLVREWVLPPEQFPSVTVAPDADLRALPRLLGFRREPWSISEGVYRAAGGLWSSFDDLVGYAQKCMRLGQRSGWFMLRDAVYYHTGQARDTGVCVIIDPEAESFGVAHAMLRGPNATKALLGDLMFDCER